MAKADLTVKGYQSSVPVRLAAGVTRIEPGEPVIQAGSTLTSGAASANVFTLAATDVGVIGTDLFGGIAMQQSLPFRTGTVVAQTFQVSRPVPWVGKIEGKGETAGNIDTAAELLAVIQDVVLIDYNATGGADGGELYTIKDTAAADTSAFTVMDGDTAKGELQVTVDGRFYRIANDIS